MDAARRWRRVGWTIPAAGLLVALVIYARAAAFPANDADDQPSKVDIRQMQEIGGEADVLGVEFNTWFVSLWHGKRLAGTVGFFSIAGCAFCLWRARISQPRA